jgi:hypothetical protein
MDHIETLKQLTGAHNPVNRLKLMLGANNFISNTDSISFRFKTSRDANYVKITLNGKDLYDVQFLKIVGVKLNKEKVFTDIPSENLKETFENYTGNSLTV